MSLQESTEIASHTLVIRAKNDSENDDPISPLPAAVGTGKVVKKLKEIEAYMTLYSVAGQ